MSKACVFFIIICLLNTSCFDNVGKTSIIFFDVNNGNIFANDINTKLQSIVIHYRNDSNKLRRLKIEGNDKHYINIINELENNKIDLKSQEYCKYYEISVRVNNDPYIYFLQFRSDTVNGKVLIFKPMQD